MWKEAEVPNAAANLGVRYDAKMGVERPEPGTENRPALKKMRMLCLAQRRLRTLSHGHLLRFSCPCTAAKLLPLRWI